ncbi:MAG: hypothetical protein NT015_10460 [Alphaproteobacteria bacterium]|nr:hypothetical protein [Alphaproteobacteria bacterium]
MAQNVDPTSNIVVFDIAGRDPWDSEGPTRTDDCVRRIWADAPPGVRAAAGRVRRVYSEWEPSDGDKQFIETTFPGVYLTWSFTRPTDPDGWNAALAAARAQLEEAMARRR